MIMEPRIKASSRNRMTFLPTALAASSFSRMALRTRPQGARKSRSMAR